MTLEENIEEKLSSHLTAVDKMVSVERISLNVSQSVIVTTEDKIRLSLASFVKSHNKRSAWLAPFSLLLSIVATLSTATFSDFILEAATWKAIFVLTGIGASAWLFRSLLLLRKAITIDNLIENIKNADSSGVSGHDKDAS